MCCSSHFFFPPLSALVPVYSHLLEITLCILCLQNLPSHCKLCYPTLLLSSQCHPPRVPGNNDAQVLKPIFTDMLSKVLWCLSRRLLSKHAWELRSRVLDFVRNWLTLDWWALWTLCWFRLLRNGDCQTISRQKSGFLRLGNRANLPTDPPTHRGAIPVLQLSQHSLPHKHAHSNAKTVTQGVLS